MSSALVRTCLSAAKRLGGAAVSCPFAGPARTAEAVPASADASTARRWSSVSSSMGSLLDALRWAIERGSPVVPMSAEGWPNRSRCPRTAVCGRSAAQLADPVGLPGLAAVSRERLLHPRRLGPEVAPGVAHRGSRGPSTAPGRRTRLACRGTRRSPAATRACPCRGRPGRSTTAASRDYTAAASGPRDARCHRPNGLRIPRSWRCCRAACGGSRCRRTRSSGPTRRAGRAAGGRAPSSRRSGNRNRARRRAALLPAPARSRRGEERPPPGLRRQGGRIRVRDIGGLS